MPFATRCPECRAKLRLDDEPADGETIECPKCGSVFAPGDAGDEVPPAPKPNKKKKKIKDKPSAGKRDPKAPRKRIAKKKKSNPILLFGLLGGALVAMIVLGIALWLVLGKAGKVDEMLCYVPSECNIVRGINTGQISKYQGFASEMDIYINSNIKTATDDLAKVVGFESGDDLRDYVVIAKSKTSGRSSTMYIFRARQSFKAESLGESSSLKATDSGGTTYYRATGRGLLNGAAVFAPTNKLLVVIANGPAQSSLISGVAGGGVKNKENMFLGKVGDAGRKIASGHLWILVRNEGPYRTYAKDIGETVKSTFSRFAKASESTPVIGWWTSFSGKGIRFGGGIECADSTVAAEIVDEARNGELGKQDDAEIPNDFKRAVSRSSSKEFREFLSRLNFWRTGKCCYFTAQMGMEKGKQYTSMFNGPGLANFEEDAFSGGRGGGPGAP